MSVFRVSKSIIKEIDVIRRDFLWGSTEGKIKFSRVAWDKVCVPKSKRGLGVINLDLKNVALLGKWHWEFVVEKEHLWRKLIISKYILDPKSWCLANINIK
ncbi:hypothetical protein REPUB_Repub19eG0114600 [Reevesia pubescens]